MVGSEVTRLVLPVVELERAVFGDLPQADLDELPSLALRPEQCGNLGRNTTARHVALHHDLARVQSPIDALPAATNFGWNAAWSSTGNYDISASLLPFVFAPHWR